ncbi:MAG TPA: ABC transporter ATP-binding protein [Gemmatimonadota bacterium]|nr:ABC transporter ATP-binding protein [Gemmatimonadota bacterium]
MELELDGLRKRFGETTALDGLDLALERGELLTLLGPSGCGKTTALRIVAGFEAPDSGRVRFRGQDVTDRSPRRRGFGMVFQNYALFPHLDVFENVAFGLRCRKAAEEEVRDRVGRVLELVDLPGFAERRVQQLSGGQQQRVALARALAIEPPLLLLDEPLSNLDAALRERTRVELRRLIKDLGITALFVTHDQEEAFDLSDRVAVMRAGTVRQVGTPEALYDRPAEPFVAGFVGRANRIRARLERDGEGRVAVLEDGTRWPLPDGDSGADEAGTGEERESRPAGPDVELWVRPEDLALGPGGPDAGSRREEAGPGAAGARLAGRVRDRRFRGSGALYRVEVPEIGVLEVAGGREESEVGDPVSVGLRPGRGVQAFPAERGPAPAGEAPSSGGAAVAGARRDADAP